MKSKTLNAVNNAVSNATPEAVSKLGLRKEHVNYPSAFAIGEHAELRMDRLGAIPFGRIEGIEFNADGIVYVVAMAINANSDQEPIYEWHSHRPIVGVSEKILCSYVPTVEIENTLKDSMPVLSHGAFNLGDIVCLDLKDIITDYNAAVVPVLIWGVSYVAGKIMYDVSISVDEYKGTLGENQIDHRWLRHSVDRVDSIFVQPVGGWNALYSAQVDSMNAELDKGSE